MLPILAPNLILLLLPPENYRINYGRITDECHHIKLKYFRKVLKRNPQADFQTNTQCKFPLSQYLRLLSKLIVVGTGKP